MKVSCVKKGTRAIEPNAYGYSKVVEEIYFSSAKSIGWKFLRSLNEAEDAMAPGSRVPAGNFLSNERRSADWQTLREYNSMSLGRYCAKGQFWTSRNSNGMRTLGTCPLFAFNAIQSIQLQMGTVPHKTCHLTIWNLCFSSIVIDLSCRMDTGVFCTTSCCTCSATRCPWMICSDIVSWIACTTLIHSFTPIQHSWPSRSPYDRRHWSDHWTTRSRQAHSHALSLTRSDSSSRNRECCGSRDGGHSLCSHVQ